MSAFTTHRVANESATKPGAGSSVQQPRGTHRADRADSWSYRVGYSVLGLLLGCVGGERSTGAVSQPSSTGRTLQVVPETTTVATDAERVRLLTARLSSAATTFSGPVRVQFEIVSGPNDRDGNSPVTPDITCNVLVGETSCQAVYVGGGSGTDEIRAWIDEDDDLLTTEADATEGRNAGSSDCTTGDPAGACSGVGTPGSVAEPDLTDVIAVDWQFAAGGVGQPCRDGTECDAGASCQGGVCVPCGQSGAPCCAGQACGAGLACQPTLNTCVACGSAGQPCCEPPIGCRTGSECVGTMCVGCGGLGERCCASGTSCNAWSSECVAGVCTPCGGVSERCCAGSPACHTGGDCDGSNGLCGRGSPSGELGFTHIQPSFAQSSSELHLLVQTASTLSSIGFNPCGEVHVTVTYAGGSKSVSSSEGSGVHDIVIPSVDVTAPSFSYRIDAIRYCHEVPGGNEWSETGSLSGLAVRVQ